MSYISFSGVRTPKVDPGKGINLATDRVQNGNSNLCIRAQTQDDYGRAADDNSLYTLEQGCDTPLMRIDVENDLRPAYHQYLNTESIEGDFGDDQNYAFMNFDNSSLNKNDAAGLPVDAQVAQLVGIAADQNPGGAMPPARQNYSGGRSKYRASYAGALPVPGPNAKFVWGNNQRASYNPLANLGPNISKKNLMESFTGMDSLGAMVRNATRGYDTMNGNGVSSRCGGDMNDYDGVCRAISANTPIRTKANNSLFPANAVSM